MAGKKNDAHKNEWVKCNLATTTNTHYNYSCYYWPMTMAQILKDAAGHAAILHLNILFSQY